MLFPLHQTACCMKNVKHIQAAVQSQNHSSTAVNAEELSQQLSILIHLQYFSPSDYLYLLWSFLERQDWNSQKPLFYLFIYLFIFYL